jgi:hypothetical protein
MTVCLSIYDNLSIISIIEIQLNIYLIYLLCILYCTIQAVDDSVVDPKLFVFGSDLLMKNILAFVFFVLNSKYSQPIFELWIIKNL